MRWIRSLSKLITRATEISHLGYSLSDLSGIALTLASPWKRNEARLVGYQVRYPDPASFRLVAFEVLVKGEYFFRAENETPFILDCGANIGIATLFFKRLYPKARIQAFEADPTTSEILRTNIERNHLQDVTVNNLLLSDHDGMEKFYVSKDTPSSLMMSASASRLAGNGREISVKAGRLSDFIDGPVDLLKLDVEGSEHAVISELVSSGKIARVRRMVVEYHHRIGNERPRLSGFLALLETAGFDYDIESRIDRTAKEGGFHDMLIIAHRP